MPRNGTGVPGTAKNTGNTATAGGVQGSALSSTRAFNVVEGQRFNARIVEIARNPRNVREDWEYEGEEFEEFRTNLAQVGGIQDPAVCTVQAYCELYPQYDGTFPDQVRYVLLAGERRYMGQKSNGAEEIPVVLRNALLAQGDLIFLGENGRRKDFSPIQEGQIYLRIHEESGLTYEEIAAKVGAANPKSVSKSVVSKRIRLFKKLQGDARQAVARRELDAESAYKLLLAFDDDPELVERARRLMLDNNLKAEAAIKEIKGESTGAATESATPPETPAQELAPGGDQVEGDQSDGEAPAGAAGEVRLPAQKPRVVDPRAAQRAAACRKVLASRSYPPQTDPLTTRYARALVTGASRAALSLARGFTEDAALGDGGESDAMLAGPDLLRLADAVVLAVDELHLREITAQGPLTGQQSIALDFLRDLQTEGAYELDETELAALAAVSPAKP